MNFLSEVMATAGKTEMNELKDKVIHIKGEISTLKLKVNDFIKRCFAQFIPLLKDDEDIQTKAANLTNEMESLRIRIETQMKAEVTESIQEVIQLTESFEESKLMLGILNKLLFIYTSLESNSSMHHSESKKEAVFRLNEVSQVLDAASEEFENLEILASIKKQVQFRTQELLTEITSTLHEYISWSEREIGIKNVQIILSVSGELRSSDLIEALNYLDNLSSFVKMFCEKLLKSIIVPIMSSPHIVTVSMNKNAQLIVQSDCQGSKQSCLVIMENLLKVFTFLSENLLVAVDDSTSFISKLDEFLAETFCDHFVENCASKSIPTKQRDFENYQKLMQQFIAFESSLKQIGFLRSKTASLSNFANNTDKLFSEKICEMYLSKARDIMKKDLHIMINVATPVFTNDSTSKVNDSSLQEFMDLNDSTFKFPACNISKSTVELLDLLKEIIQDIIDSKCVPLSIKLFSTARNIVSMYCDIALIYHTKLLQSIPQQAALFYNNCFYLAHMTVFLAFEFKAKLPESLDSHLVTFVDFVQPLRKTGLSVFSAQVQTQKKQIIDIIKDSGLTTLGDSPVFPPTIERSIRQCLRQLKLLQTVWQQVLPESSYTKTMSSLANSLIEDLMKCIISLEDIAADIATNLVSLFNIVIDDVPRLFFNANEVHRLIKKWGKFIELNRILGGTLQQIDERWADGKGPLAEEFSAEQLKHLIRALFKNTDRRANVLARIK